jgi:hypothetical protein
MERLENLQKAFSSLTAACSKREQMEKQLRTRLEKENDVLRLQAKVYFQNYSCSLSM